MQNTLLLFLLPILTVALGYGMVYKLQPKGTKNLKLLLAFSGAFLLSITVFNFLPQVYKNSSVPVGIYIMLGILLQIILEYFSKGAEHGHIHLEKNKTNFPWLLFISLSIHSVLEGLPINAHNNLIYGICIHKLPVSIILATFFLVASLDKPKIVFFLTVFALMTPLGILLGNNVPFIKSHYYEISGVVIGIFLHISTTILFETNENHTFNFTKLITIISAIVLAYFI